MLLKTAAPRWIEQRLKGASVWLGVPRRKAGSMGLQVENHKPDTVKENLTIFDIIIIKINHLPETERAWMNPLET